MFESIKRRLSRKIMFALAFSAACFIAAIVSLVVAHQKADMLHEMHTASDNLEHAIYAGIKYPMTIGNRQRVEQVLLEIEAAGKGLEVYICDTEQNIIFATRAAALHTRVSSHVSNKTSLQALDGMLKTGYDSEMTFEDRRGGGARHIVTFYPLLNSTECYRCHGASKKVLGGMVVRKNAEENYTTIEHLRDYNIAIGMLGIVALTTLMYVLLRRMVKQPLRDCTDKIDELRTRIPAGDYSARIEIERPDEIGTLIDSFNHMAETLEEKNDALQRTHGELANANKELRSAKEALEEMNAMLELRVEEKTRALQESERQVRAFASRLGEAGELERKRLSEELHDEVGQQLSLLSIHLNMMLMRSSGLPESERARIADSIALLDRIAEKTRNIMANLRPPVLDDYGLPAALKWCAEEFSKRTGIEVDMKADPAAPRPAPRVEIVLFRVAQELLTNVAKHAGATRTSVSLGFDGTRLRMEIADNGAGFDPAVPRPQGHWGLVNVAERIESVGGTLRIHSGEGCGTRVIVEVDV